MGDKQNPIWKADVEVAEELARQGREAAKNVPTEYGMEKATAHDWRQMVKKNEEFRKTQLEEMGVKDFIKRWRGKSK